MNEIERLNKRLKRTQSALTAAENLAENKLRDAYYTQEKLQTEIENRKIIESNLKATIIEKDKALSVRTQFLQNMSHKLKTPMNGIIGMSEVLDNNRETLNQEQILCLDVIQDCSDNLLKMIENTIQYAQLTTSIYRSTLHNCNLREMLKDFITFYLYSNKINKINKINITYNISSLIPSVILTDKRALIKVITRLLDNAVQFSPPNSNIIISVSTHTFPNDRLILLFDVSDTGPGLSESEFKKLTTNLKQFNHSETQKNNLKLGLGLIICKLILNNVKGDFSVKANVPSGSIVSFTFPAMIKLPHK